MLYFYIGFEKWKKQPKSTQFFWKLYEIIDMSARRFIVFTKQKKANAISNRKTHNLWYRRQANAILHLKLYTNDLPRTEANAIFIFIFYNLCKTHINYR